jgi:hypothetical protein
VPLSRLEMHSMNHSDMKRKTPKYVTQGATWQAAGRQPPESAPVGAARHTGHAGLSGRLPRKLPKAGRDPDADHARDQPQAFSAVGGVVSVDRLRPENHVPRPHEWRRTRPRACREWLIGALRHALKGLRMAAGKPHITLQSPSIPSSRRGRETSPSPSSNPKYGDLICSVGALLSPSFTGGLSTVEILTASNQCEPMRF